MAHKSRTYDLVTIVFVLTLSGLHNRLAFAGELILKPSVKSSVSIVNREFEEVSQTERVLTLAPSLSTLFSGKRASLSMRLKHSAITRDLDNGSSGDNNTDNYTDVKLASQVVLIENLLNLQVSAGQSYRARSQSQFDFSDTISAPDDLAKLQSNQALLSFTLPNSPYIGLNFQTSVSHKKSDRAVGNGNGVNGSNVLFAANIFQGRKVQNYTFNFSAQHNNTTRANFGDFKSTNLYGKVGVGLWNDFSAIAQGRLDDYDSKSLNLNLPRRNLDTESYGVGIRWQPRISRVIELTYNQLKEDVNTSEFVGAFTQWSFSNRTSMTFDYGKRFYGDAYTFKFDYNLKSLRGSMSYNEDVTTFARLDTTTQVVGIFVCTFGSSALEDCFQPDGLNYVLQPGEEFRSLMEISSDIAEDVLFRKNGNVSIGYAKRKLQASLNLTRGTTEYLESARETTRTSASLNVGYKLGRRSNVSIVTSISQQTAGDESDKSRTFLSTLSFDRSFKQNLQGSFSLRYAKRSRNNSLKDFINSTVNASLVYHF